MEELQGISKMGETGKVLTDHTGVVITLSNNS
jgi:hypothetical protein